MARIIRSPSVVEAAGTPPKRIEEFVGRVNTPGTTGLSIARMVSPAGWSEPGQTPAFDEYSIILRGTLQVESREGMLQASAGQAVIAEKGQWVRYSTPGADGAEYLAVCVPAFSVETVSRDPA